jgi:hypothetical protein
MHRKWFMPTAEISLFEELPNPTDYAILDRGYKGTYSPPKDDDIYVELENSSLKNNQFHDILKTADNSGWFEDETVATALQLLANVTDCTNHRIALLAPWQVMEFAQAGRKQDPDKELANHPGTALEDTWATFRDIIAAIQDKDFLFLPISDGYLPTDETYLEKVPDGNAGIHWALLVVDCRGPVLSAMYYNSLDNFDMNDMEVLCYRGAYFLLRQTGLDIAQPPSDESQWYPQLAKNTPQQGYRKDNAVLDAGACGPFVWMMAKELIQYIIDWREELERAGDEVRLPGTFDLDLPPDYAPEVGFNSKHTRHCIRALCAREKRIQACKKDRSALCRWTDSGPS